ncbi:LysE/ArgO family amino acid transporter [Rhodovulum sp. DZ06]|uniref:LysE/ArgO family amino acid transporter n=1 Tax=Rhodovulum sp. DZ06 TaxID=3425126 RepID=UPI003D32D7BF
MSAATFVPAALAGFATGFSLILAIGAQNAFVLRQGLARTHVFWVCLTCAVSDAVLVIAGVAGMGALIAGNETLRLVMTWGGAAFLLAYGALRLRAAWRGEAMAMQGAAEQSLRAALLATLAFTWLNPHVYLDTLALIGAISTDFPPADRPAFAAGAVTSSFVFFFGLGYGARLLAPLFALPAAWRVLDVLIAAVMWTIAATLILG